METYFRSWGAIPHRTDTAWTEAERWLRRLQARACADPLNNPRRTDTYWRILYKIAASNAGCEGVDDSDVSDPDVPVEAACAEAVISPSPGTVAFKFQGMAVNGNEALAIDYNGLLLSTDDGITWTPQTSGKTELAAAAYGGGVWVAVGSQGATRIVITSANRVDWVDHSVVATGIIELAYGNGVFVGLGSGDQIYTSSNAEVWALRDDLSPAVTRTVAFGGGLFMVAGNNGFIATSPDGITWTTQTSGSVEDLVAVAYQSVAGVGTFVAVSDESLTVLVSTNAGVTWAPVAIPSAGGTEIYTIAAGGGLFVVPTWAQEVWISSDGLTWTRQMPDTDNEVSVIRYYDECEFVVNQAYGS